MSGKPDHAGRLLALAMLGANALFIGLSVYFLYTSRTQYAERAETQTQNVARAVDQNVSRSIDRVDLALRAVVDELERQLAGKGIDERQTLRFVARYEERLPEVEAFRVANAQGLVILGKGLDRKERPSWADRDYFMHLRDHPDAGLQISPPRKGRVAKRAIIGFARRYNNPDGSFAGVVSAPIAVDHFDEFLQGFDVGKHGTLILRYADLGLIVRLPPIPGQPVGEVGNKSVSSELRKLVESGVPAATYHLSNSPDGYERILTFHRLRNAPMFAIVGMASGDYLASWTTEVYKTAAMAAGFLLFTALVWAGLRRLMAQRQKREEALRASTLLLDSVVDNVPSMLFMKNADDLRFELFNRAGETLLDAPRNELVGRNDYELFPQEQADFFRKTDRQALARDGVLDIPEEPMTTPRGVRMLHTRKVALHDEDGRPTHLLGISEDITERLRLERSVAESEQRMELALAGADLGLWDYDIVAGTMRHSERLLSMLGYEPGDITPDAASFRLLLHPSDAADFMRAYLAHLKGQTPAFEIEYRVRRKDDHWAWLLSRGKVVERNPEGRALRMIGTNLDITQRKENEAALKARQARLASLIASMQDTVVVFDTSGTIVEYFAPDNARCEKDERSPVGRTCGEAFPAHVATLYDDALAGILTDGAPRTFEYAVDIEGGQRISKATTAALVGDRDYPTGFLTVIRDVTEERTAQRELERLAQKNAILLQSVGEGIFGVDMEQRTTFINPAAQSMLGFTEQDVLGHDAHALFHYVRFDGSAYPESDCAVSKTLADGQIRRIEDDWYWRKDGTGFPVASIVTPIMKNGRRAGAVVVFQDISQRKAYEARIRELAFYDSLTRLPNRRLLLDRLGLALPASARRDAYGALMFLDLDNFKNLNDSKGHDYGDLLLAEVARRLLSSVRMEDTVARLGGDEFVVMLEDLGANEAQAASYAEGVAQKIRETLSLPYLLKDFEFGCSSSIGVTLFKGMDPNAGELLKRADAAMYEAKAAGRNAVRVFRA